MSEEKELKALRRWMRAHEPEYLQRRMEYNKSDKVKDQRKKVSKKRRHSTGALISVIKKTRLVSPEGKTYEFKRGRIVETDGTNKYVVRADKKGNIHRLEYEDDKDLEDDRYDMPLIENEKIKLYKSVKRLLDGDEKLERELSKKTVTEVKEIPTDSLYWKHMTADEKKELLDKLKSLDSE